MFYIGEKDKEKTLFVKGTQNPNEILQRCLLHGISRVHLGFENSFKPALVHPVNDWNFMFDALTEAKITIDLELDAYYTNNIKQWDWVGYEKFNAIYESGGNEVKQIQ